MELTAKTGSKDCPEKAYGTLIDANVSIFIVNKESTKWHF